MSSNTGGNGVSSSAGGNGVSSAGGNGVSTSTGGNAQGCYVCMPKRQHYTSSQKGMFIMHLYSSILVMTFTLV